MPDYPPRTLLLHAVACGLTLVVSSRSLATDRDLEYLHSLQGREFGDVAVSYLESLSKTGDMSPAVHDVFDLEMSKSLRAEAQNVADPAQRSVLIARSQKFLESFVRNNPNHPEALQAQIASAEILFEQARSTIADEQSVKDDSEKDAALLQARNELAQAKNILKPSVDKLITRFRALGPPPTRRIKGHAVLKDHESMTHKEREQEAQRQELQFDLIRASGELALLDYYRAQTYGNSDDDAVARRSALNASAKLLDAYYQVHRNDTPLTELGRSGFIGASVAHTWYAKTLEELGDRTEAKAVLDEVLGNFPDPPNPKKLKDERTGLEPILARAKFYSLELLEKSSDAAHQKQFIDEAKDFIDNYAPLFRTEWGYQATALQLAKHLINSVKSEPAGKQKTADNKEAVAILKEMSSVPSEFQSQAAELLQQIDVGVNPTNIDEARGFIRIAMEEKKWDQAAALCRSAIDLLNKQPKRDANYLDLIGKLQDTIAQCQIQPIFEDFSKNREPFNQEKYEAWLVAGEKAAEANKKSMIAPRAGAFAVYCATVLYGKAHSDSDEARTVADQKRAAAEIAQASAQMKETTDFVLSNFPSSPEADEARISLAREKMMNGDIAGAIADFESIDPKSERYPEALRVAGELHVEQLQSELKKPADKQDKSLVEKYRQQAVAALGLSSKEKMSLMHTGDAIPPELIKSQLLLAQIYLGGNQYSQAVKVLQPLIDAAYAAKSQTALDDTMLKIFSAAVRAYMALDDFKRAGQAGTVLIDLGPDKREVNGVLIDFVRRLDIELKGLRDQLDKLGDSDPTETQSLRGRIASVKQMMSTMVAKLADRKDLDPKSMVYLGILFTDIDDFESAKQQYQKVSGSPGIDERLKLWVGGQLVDILGKEGQLDKATAEIAKLRQQKPNNLDFMKVEAQLFQEWAQSDPSRYDTAAQKWTDIRLRLRYQKAKEASIYYDAVYNAAFCYFMEANDLALNPNKHADAIRKCQNAEQVLNSELIPNPKLDGPQSVNRFQDLLSDAQKLSKRLR